MDNEVLKKEFIPKYLSQGENKFCRFLLVYSLNKIAMMEKKTYKGTPPNLELLEYYDRFLALYRIEHDDVCLKLSGLFRRIAHKIYRIMLKKRLTGKDNRFLNAVI